MPHLWWRLGGLLPVITLVIGVNVAVDPVHVLGRHRYEAGIARMILAGQNVTNIYNPHEAAYLRYSVAGLTSRKDVLVLGSSRSKLIRSSFFPDRTFFNNSIGGAGLTDYLAIYALYQRRGFIPAQLVMELSPWMVNGPYASIWEDFNKEKAELEALVLLRTQPARSIWDWRSPIPQAYWELISPGYFQTSLFTGLRQLRTANTAQTSYFAYRIGDLPLGETLLADGSTVYAEPLHSQAYIEKVRADALAYAQNPAGISTEIDAHQLIVLEAFVRQLQHEGVEILFYLPPYHPTTYSRLVSSERYKIVMEVQRTLEQLAQRNRIKTVGSYNPVDVAMADSDFFDGSHMTANGIARLFASQLGSESPGMVPLSEPQIVGITNPNGLEVVNSKPFFWIGEGETCYSVRSPRVLWATFTLQAVPGPSLPDTPERHLRVRAAGGYTTTVEVWAYPAIKLTVPIQEGYSELCLTALDQPTVTTLTNGDKRPLLMGISDTLLEALPLSACRAALTKGWYHAEFTGPDWLRWSGGRGELRIWAGRDSLASLSGKVLAAQRPDSIDVLLNGVLIKTMDVSWSQWEFRDFDPLALSLRAGENLLQFVGHNPPLSFPGDSRALALALKNLHLVADDGPTVCELQP